MRFSLFSNVILLAQSAQSISTASRRTNAISRRRIGVPIQLSNDLTAADILSYNWAGIISSAPPQGWNYQSVSASVIVPQPSVPKGQGDGVYSAALWVGIDGSNWPRLWQAGVNIIVEKKGDKLSYSYYAWYEWFPDPEIRFDSIPIKAGDLIQITVMAIGPNEGLVLLKNESTKVSVNQTVTSNYTLALQSVEWIVEDSSSLDHLLPLANWTTVKFLDTYSILSNGTAQRFFPAGTGGINVIISENSTLVSSVSLDDAGGEIVVKCV